MTIFFAVVAVLSLIANVIQAGITKDLKAKQEDQEREVNQWQMKHESVALRLANINPGLTVRLPAGHDITLYPTIFPDVEFRKMIERYIVHVERSGTMFVPRSPTELELRSPALRETVTKTTEILDAFCKKNPDLAAYRL
jgi:Na+-transporting NADH:ubiquinone oxidoreductase subunit NqrC